MDIVQSNPWLWIAMAVVLVVLILMIVLRPKAPVTAGGWKGPFYINPADPALFVPSRWGWGLWRRRWGWGLGYTLNFGNRWSWVVLAALVALSLAPIWYVIVALQRAFTLPSN